MLAQFYSRRRLLKVASLAGVGGLLAACGGSSANPTATSSSAAAPTTASSATQASGGAQPTATKAAGSGSPQTAASPTTSSGGGAKTVTWAAGSDIVTLDGGFVTDVVTNTIIDLVFSRVVRYDVNMEVQPDLADKWETGSDGVTWTFNLKSGPKFSNGNPVTSEAVKFTLDRLLDEKTAAPNRSVFTAIDHIDTPDPQTVKIVTKQPFPDLLTALADRSGTINDPSEVKKYSDPQEYGRHPVGSGQYAVQTWDRGVSITLTTNPNYAGTKPAVGTIVFRPVPEDATRLAMLKSGEADIITQPVLDELNNIRQNPKLKVFEKDGYNFIMYELLTDKKPLDDVRVRQALNMAVDRDSLAKDLLNGLVTPASEGAASPVCSTVSPGVGKQFYFPQPCWPYDPDKAKSLLKEAGYGSGFDLEIWSPSGRYLKDREVSEAVQSFLNAIGIRAKLQTFDFATYQKKWNDPARQMWMIGRSAGNTDYMFTRLFAKSEWDKGANNNTHFSDPQVEDLLVKARSELDVKKRADDYKQIQEITWKYVPAVYLYTQKVIVAHSAAVTGVDAQPNEVLVLNNLSKA